MLHSLHLHFLETDSINPFTKMFLNKADKKELFKITFTPLLVMVKIQ